MLVINQSYHLAELACTRKVGQLKKEKNPPPPLTNPGYGPGVQ